MAMLEINDKIELTWLPDCEEIRAVAKYHAWGTPKGGDSSVGERDFMEDGPELVVTELKVGLFRSFIPLDLHKVDSVTRSLIERHVLDAVGEEALAEKLWEQDARHEAESHG